MGASALGNYAPVHNSECISTIASQSGPRNMARSTDCLGAAVRWTTRNPPPNVWSCPLRWYGTEPPPDGLALGTMRRIVGLMRPYWRRVTVGFGLGIAMLAITSFIPLVTKTIIDDGLTKGVPGVLARETALLM